MRRLTILFTILTVITTVSFGQTDHLEPAKDFSEYDSITGGILNNYYNSLFDILLADTGEKTIVRYLVLPSFNAEYALSIARDSNEKYKLTARICSESYWYSKDKKTVKIKTKEKSIDTDFAVKVKELFDKVIGQIKKQTEVIGADGAASARLDGTTYYFTTATDSGQLITGATWSPSKGTKMRKLVQICEDLYYFTNAKTNNGATIINDIDKLLDEL